KNPTFDTVVLYPNKGVSEIQEKQMLYFTNDRTKAFAVERNFDDCQTFVKKLFSNYPKNSGVMLSSANSINIGRLIPQVIYYVYAYLMGVKSGFTKFGEKFNVCVPTGNFGDIFAGYIAKQMGVPIDKLVCASNVNNVLTSFFKTGVYDKNREFKKSNSPAMDILISSNLERLVYLATGRNGNRVKELMDSLNSNGKYSLNEGERSFISDFVGGFSTESETLSAINKVFTKFKYLIDPHTAVAYDCYEKLNIQGKTLIISTASPYKFPSTVAGALNLDVYKSEFEIIKELSLYTKTTVPANISKLQLSKKTTVIKTKEEIEKIVRYENLKAEIKVPATSANLGCAFDCTGVALSLYNSFIFEKSDSDELVNFNGDKDNNLVLKAYKKLFEVSGRDYVPVKITLKKCSVPSSRGLGSSATCIVAGVLGANYMLKNAFTKDYLLSVMTKMEGHPDNVAPAYLGGMVIAYDYNGEIKTLKVEVNKNLKVYACIPSIELSTNCARSVLPKTVSYKDAVNNIVGSALIKSAFELGDIDMIKRVFCDKLHEPYRYPLIKGGEEVKKLLTDMGFAVAISGAGPTILAVTKNKTLQSASLKNIGGVKWTVKLLHFDKKGTVIYD
ncbi:MAG: homoserine kinase, partial [Clostridia bacterium]|nr:homoserine kinase [Clostridia bacterium]